MAQILIVDDEASVRQVLARWIASAGHTVREAASAAAALEEAEHHEPAVVFCDVQMPGRDGIWLTGELGKRYPATAVVLATAVSTVPPPVSLRPAWCRSSEALCERRGHEVCPWRSSGTAKR